MADYLPIVLLFLVATAFVLGSFIASAVLGPSRRETAAKIAPYECGIVPDKEPAERFPVKFYLVAMLFIIFDIEIIFLYPYAVDYRVLGVSAFWTMMSFSVVFFAAFVYVIARGALEWGPIRKERPLVSGVSAERTTTSTIRRVGLEGRDKGAAA